MVSEDTLKGLRGRTDHLMDQFKGKPIDVALVDGIDPVLELRLNDHGGLPIVVAIAGVEAGKTGKVLYVDRASGRVLVEGLNLVKKALRKSLLKYQLHQDTELFDKAYGYIRQYY